MRKDLGVGPLLYPMPVLMIATYNDDGTVDVMNMAWGGICAGDKVALNIGEAHKTSANIAARKAFTISVADVDHIAEADFFGIASGNTMADKFERTGLTATKSTRVDAPIIEEFPVTLECEAIIDDTSSGWHRVIGKILNVTVHEEVVDENGKIDPTKVNAFVFDQFQNGYYAIGEKLGDAWSIGKPLMDGGQE